MRSVWHLAEVGEVDFAANATLLALKTKQQSLITNKVELDDSDDESESSYAEEEENITSRPTHLQNSAVRRVLIDKFLDRLAEIFSREKSSFQDRTAQHGGHGAKHVTATAWVRANPKSSLTILLAKNEGLDSKDRQMLFNLQLRLRDITRTGQCPPVPKDLVWIGRTGLVEFSRGRLLHHITQVKDLHQSVVALSGQSTVYGPVISCIGDLCKHVTPDSPTLELSNIVNIAYLLRHAWKDIRIDKPRQKLVRSINMLSRLRAGYECLKCSALTFEEMSSIEMRPVEFLNCTTLDISLFRQRLKSFLRHYGLPRGILKTKSAQQLISATRLHIHAEMQILASLAIKNDWHNRAHSYIGISKKSCFLCSQILQNYILISTKGDRRRTFDTRPCHEKLYPFWTLPLDHICTPDAAIAWAEALRRTCQKVRESLQGRVSTQPAIAESSAGVTCSSSFPTGLSSVKRQHLARQQRLNSSEIPRDSEEPLHFGRKVKAVQVGLLPADGSIPVLKSINFHAIPEGRGLPIPEFGQDLIPDFRGSWGECHMDRHRSTFTAENQAAKETNGQYRLYWNSNQELPQNESIKSLIGLDNVDSSRRFWYGDAYIVRFSEDPTTFVFDINDVPVALFEGELVRILLESFWKECYLEDEVERDRAFREQTEKSNADKALILARMTESERDVLTRMPAGTLEYLAITACDHGALGDVQIDPDPLDPSMLQITTLTHTTALDELGWEGFSSSHL